MMALSQKQRGQLCRAPAAARAADAKGRPSPCLAAWQTIEAANRIFGPDGWDRETVEMRCAATKQYGSILSAAYVAKVRVTVHAEDRPIVREGQGCGEGRGETPFEAHDMGLKAAETDATRRALATFGRALGLGVYLGERPAKPKGKSKAGSRREGDNDSSAESSTEGDDGPASQDSGSPAPEPSPSQSSPLPAGHEISGVGGAATPRGTSRPESSEGPGDASNTPGWEPDDDSPPGGAPGGRSRRVNGTHGQLDGAPLQEAGAATPSDTPESIHEPSCGTVPKMSPSAMLLPKERRVRDKEHLRFVAAQPCLICDRKPADAHHLRFAQPTAMAKKVSDEFTVPLCRLHHRQLHRDPDEQGWWRAQGIEPLEVAEELWRERA